MPNGTTLMVQGIVNDRLEAVVRLRLRGTSGATVEVDAVIDTGFSGSLSLPMSMVNHLGLARWAESNVVLADGSSQAFEMYSVDVEWENSLRHLLAYGMGNDVLVGMRFLVNCELQIDVTTGGRVDITKL